MLSSIKCPEMYSHSVHSVLQNKTIEERVTILEAQMSEIQPDIVEVKDEVAFLFDEVAVLMMDKLSKMRGSLTWKRRRRV